MSTIIAPSITSSRTRYKLKLIPKCDVITTMNYAYFSRNNVNLSRYRITDLKKIAKYNTLISTGNKALLIPRINSFFSANIYAVSIQRFVRGALTRSVLQLRKTMFKYRTETTNEIDFYTMEPISTIPDQLFIAYEASPKIIFAFNVFSLMLYYKMKGVFINPYTRETLPREITLVLLRFYLLTYAMFDAQINKLVEVYEEGANITKVLYTTASRAYAIEYSLHISVLCKRPRSLSWSSESGAMIRDAARAAVMAIRCQPVEMRIDLAFREISRLGTFAVGNWFRDLTKHSYVRFYNCIYNLWRYSGEILPATKENICCLGDPFNYQFIMRFVYSEHTIAQVQELCISLIEELVFTGTSLEFRQLGAFQVLSALTSVSLDARTNIPWLVDSII